MKILVIDDEPHIRRMMRLTLEAAGYEIDEAASGEEGLAHFADGRSYDAVVLDQKLPGMDGLDTLKRLKERAADATVLMVTAYASVELAVDAMKLGATDFLRKPMTPETLRAAVAAALAGRATRPATRARGAAGSAERPRIATLTLNGFQILQEPEPPDPTRSHHVFRVKHFADGSEFTVTVTIDPEIVARVARLTQRNLQPGGGFWRGQAERLLSAYLWSEGKAPAGGQLTVRDVSRDDIDIAAAWQSD